MSGRSHSQLAFKDCQGAKDMASQARRKTRNLPSQERSRQTVEAILESTARILTERGFDGASTNLIAQKAGVSIGSLYQYFPNKEAVVGALIGQIYREDLSAIEVAFQRSGHRRFEILILAVIRTLLRRFSERKRLRQIIYQEVPRTGQVQTVISVKTVLIEFLSQYLAARPDFSGGPNLPLKLFVIVNSIEATLYAAVFEAKTRTSEKALLNELKELIIRYLRTR
jgi:AcrR family transcriptional regulator